MREWLAPITWSDRPGRWDPLGRVRFRIGTAQTGYQRAMFGVLFLLFVVVPIADLVLLVRLGRAVGVFPIFALVLGTVSLGMVFIRAQGTRMLAAMARELATGRIPGRQMLDGLAILMGGALLIAPGLLTDAAGLTLLFPPTRRWLQAGTRRWMERQLEAGVLTMSVLRWDSGGPPVREDSRSGLNPQKEILVPPPEGGGDPVP